MYPHFPRGELACEFNCHLDTSGLVTFDEHTRLRLKMVTLALEAGVGGKAGQKTSRGY
jgi:hypothetical protein